LEGGREKGHLYALLFGREVFKGQLMGMEIRTVRLPRIAVGSNPGHVGHFVCETRLRRTGAVDELLLINRKKGTRTNECHEGVCDSNFITSNDSAQVSLLPKKNK
jgi:hypothetical protein